MGVINNQTVKNLLQKYEPIWALNQISRLAAWDTEVYMPPKGAAYRGDALAKIQGLAHKYLLEKELKELVSKADEETLNDFEAGIVRVLKRDIDYANKLPAEFVEEFEKTVNQAQLAWRKARRDDNFSDFSPWLKKVIDLNRTKADYLGYNDNPYDALLNSFEEGLRVKELDQYFDNVRETVTSLLKEIKNSRHYDQASPLSSFEYNQADMERLNHKALEMFAADSERIRLDVSTHPFSEGLSVDDVRITTRYEGYDFIRSLTSTLHEFGHGIYFMQNHTEISKTPIYGGVSLGIHESQSRFYENILGRSRAFVETFKDNINMLGSQYNNFSAEDYYRYFNQVKPGLIRVEADEVTYHLHIYIRYEIEKKIINREVKVDELPELWNKYYLDNLGITPENNAVGVLQDIHWSMGAIGYFPTYSTGTVLSAMIAEKFKNDGFNKDELIKNGDISVINNYLKENVHQYGSTYTFKQMAARFGSEFSTTAWKNYLFEKYQAIYN